MSEEALAGWALLLRPDVAALVARVSAHLGVSTARCLDVLTPRELFALSKETGLAVAEQRLGESPATDSQLAGFFG